jgi:hypothetical protein
MVEKHPNLSVISAAIEDIEEPEFDILSLAL